MQIICTLEMKFKIHGNIIYTQYDSFGIIMNKQNTTADLGERSKRRTIHMFITETEIKNFKTHLIEEERANATVNKYIADITAFAEWLGERVLDKSVAMAYKSVLLETHAARSVNAAIAALNKFFDFINRADCRLKAERIQTQVFADEERELTPEEYTRLLNAAKGNIRLYYMLMTFAGTGIRVSELQYITVEAVKKREAIVKNKGKTRTILIEEILAKEVLKYAKIRGIKSGSIFITRTGKPLNRTNIWREMKALCKKADVSDKKVFPHNFRHLFARMFYVVEKNLVKLASVLGHSNINTTKIYTLESEKAHRSVLNKMIKLMGLNGHTT